MRELPPSWEYRRVDQVGDVQLGRQRSPALMAGPYMRPYLRVANVLDGHIDYSDVLEMNFSPYEAETFGLLPGDILLNEGQALDLVGRCAIFDGPPGMCFQNTLLRFRSHTVLPKFAAATFKHWLDRGEFRKLTRQTTSVAHLGAGQFSSMLFPLAPLREQQQIVEILDSVDDLINYSERILQKKLALRKAMLASLTSAKEANATMADVLEESPKNGLYRPWSDYGDDGVPIIRIDSIRGGEVDGIETLRRVRINASEGRIFGVRPGDILINRVNTADLVGKSAIIRDVTECTVFESNIMRCHIKEGIARARYIALWLGTGVATSHFRNSAKSAIGQASINQRDVTSCPVALPSLPDQLSLIQRFESVRLAINLRKGELLQLRLLKQGLMGDLLTGRVRLLVR